MSALTDLFTALANKIRSKTGEATTYTPLQMVSDGIDDVYQAGVDAGETPTQTKTVTAGTSAVTVTPDTGYALSSVTVNPTPSQSKVATPTTSAQTVTPNSGYLLSQVDVAPIPSEYKIPMQIIPGNTPTSMTAGEAYSPTQNAYIIDGYTSVTPSNTSPAPLYSGMIKSEGSGYAISSYSSTSKTPSSTGTYFSSGWNRMTASGYAYSSQPMAETVLWTNPTTTSSGTWAAQTINLSQSIENFSYIGILWTRYWNNGDADEKTATTIYKVNDIKKFTGASGTMEGVIGAAHATNNYVRTFIYASNTSLTFRAAYRVNAATTENNACVPLKVIGYK